MTESTPIYKSTYNINYWETNLERNLNNKEKSLLFHTEIEYKMNKKILNIFNVAKTHNLHIPVLTKLEGNCIFESLMFHLPITNIQKFREGFALLMLSCRNTKITLPNQDPSESSTIEDLFAFNDIEYVICKKRDKMYTYNFDTMCLDLSTDTSWTRLNVDLLFTIMSVLLQLKFIIIHSNTGHVTNIDSTNSDDTKTIYLGLIDEEHYIPLDVNKDNIEYDCLLYTKNYTNFHTWAKCVSEAKLYEIKKRKNLSEMMNKFNSSTNQNNILSED
jgi:hypothetical protein